MRLTSQLKRDLLYRAYSLPIPRNISEPFVTLVCHWVENSGEEWTVDRLKSIKLDIIRVRAGLGPVSSWIKKGTRGTCFSGSLAAIERFSRKGDSFLSTAVQLIQVYSWFCASGLTTKQSKKFLDGVQADPPSKVPLDKAKAILDVGCYQAHLRKVRQLPLPKPIVEMVPSNAKRAPLPNKSVPEIRGIIDSLDYLWMSEKGRNHYCQFRTLYDSVMEGLHWYRDYLHTRSGPYGPLPNMDKSFVVGRIGLIQEPGYKLRAVANPGRVFQRVLQPFGDSIYKTLALLPWDCTFNQTKGFSDIQKTLDSGHAVHSIDLSGATDYFPLELQTHLLRKLYPPGQVDLFESISKASWEMPGIGQISWRRGQPLGLYPSFGSFALTHGVLLLGLLKEPYKGQFYILGDDVVILDDAIAHSYKELLASLGCPISETKSLTSNSLCEFGGKILTSQSVIPQFKWRVISDDSFLDLVRNLGCRAVKLLRARQRAVVQKLSSLPECLGGFGWNPKGIPLEERLQEHSWIFDPESPNSRMMSYTGPSIRNLMNSESYTRARKAGSMLDSTFRGALDQRAHALTIQHIGGEFSPLFMLLGKNLDAVVNGLTIDIPIEAMLEPSSTLQVWEHKLGQQ